MSTTFYLHNATNTQAGTFPSGTQSGVTPTATAAGAATVRLMNPSLGALQSSLTVTSLANITQQKFWMGIFTSNAFAVNQTVGGGAMVFNIASSMSNANANFWVNGMYVYVWRPSTGQKIGVIHDSTSSILGTIPGQTSERVTYVTGISTNAVAGLVGDVIICEFWATVTQSNATARTDVMYFDGNTITNTNGGTTTSAASYIRFNESLSLLTARPRAHALVF